MSALRTRVGIVGAGPAGLVLANLLLAAGVDCVLLERHHAERLRTRARAGLVEHRTVALLDAYRLADRLLASGPPHGECEFRAPDLRFVLDYGARTGRPHRVYPQQELVGDLLDGYTGAGGRLVTGAAVTAVDGHVDRPRVRAGDLELTCDVLVGCDGRHGAVRRSLPPGAVTTHPMAHGLGWLAVLAAVPPATPRIVYAAHPRGFAGHMLRGPHVSRFYLQCAPDDTPACWPADRIWAELSTRLGTELTGGALLETAVLDMRSQMVAPLRYGQVLLAGDAAHVLTPAGAKGMNLAVADAGLLAELIAHGDDLDHYSPPRVADAWRAQEFSRSLIDLLHAYPADTSHAAFRQELARTRLRGLAESREQAAAFAAGYAGPP